MSLIQVLPGRIFVVPDEPTKALSWGFVLPAKEGQEAMYTGTVINVGPGVTEVKPGDRVLYAKFGGHDTKFAGVKYRVLQIDDLYAVEQPDKCEGPDHPDGPASEGFTSGYLQQD